VPWQGWRVIPFVIVVTVPHHHQGADDDRKILTVIRSAITAWRCGQFELASCPQLALRQGQVLLQPFWAF
jgi:hypothetical protein